MTAKHKRVVGDTLFPLNAIITLNGVPVDLSSYTVKFEIEKDDGTAVLAATTTGVTSHPTQTFTAEADDEYLTCNGHGVKPGQQIQVANSGGALPTGLAASTRYWPINITANRFQVAAYPDGPAVTFTTDGTGTNTFFVVGSVQYDFSTTAAGTVGNFRGWFTLISGSEQSSWPNDELGIPIEIAARGN